MNGRMQRRTLSLTAVCGAGLLLPLCGCPLPPPEESGPAVALQTVASGLTAPLALVHANDGSGRLFIADQIGVVRVVDGDGLRSTPFLDLRDRLAAINSVYDERGLLGLAFHPEYDSNGRFFVYYSPDMGMLTRLSEFAVSGADANVADAASERIILEIPQPQNNHNGGQLAFGPDGYLYIGVGDGGAANDQGGGHTPDLGNGQDLTTLLGKILRIDVDAAIGAYGVPADNPFVGDTDARGEIYAYGLRNPWRFSFDVNNGASRLFVGDVGQNLWEEIDLVDSGDNLGWYFREGANCFDPDDVAPDGCMTGLDGSPLVDPILQYPHSQNGQPVGISVIGGYVYRGSAIDELRGKYIFGDYSRTFFSGDGTLFVATEEDGAWSFEELGIVERADERIGRFVLGFGTDQAGELYVCTSAQSGPSGSSGVVYKLVPAD